MWIKKKEIVTQNKSTNISANNVAVRQLEREFECCGIQVGLVDDFLLLYNYSNLKITLQTTYLNKTANDPLR